jgi:hypothetical protein
MNNGQCPSLIPRLGPRYKTEAIRLWTNTSSCIRCRPVALWFPFV